jgi:hypothetical protein
MDVKVRRTAREIDGYLTLVLGENANWFVGWSAPGGNEWFATSEMPREKIVAWLEETVKHVQT